MSANWYERHILPTALDVVCGMPMMGRDIDALLIEAGFALPDSQTRYLRGPRPFSFHYWGETLANGAL